MRTEALRYEHRQDKPAKTWRIEMPEPVYPGAVVSLDDEWRPDYWDDDGNGFRFGPATVWVDTRTVEIRFHQPVTGQATVVW